ncbi:hypothetical protein VT84_06680 [Gemmata sp. SH-PL17]|uniref:hypothetical protein n=1 Tax=Gemmata sp. SH-PL17 TaxID=1630693 RepID=UPI00078EE9EE|nr:hypothetical protein [Gemmata sp. SH-PL17]AMV24063.1 hypothetical protein VT84_06680 [Gemmata sp. SH-PL17]
MTEELKTKVCKICEKEKPLSEFGGCGFTRDRLQTSCKPCHERQRLAGRMAGAAKRAALASARSEAPISDAHVGHEPIPIPYPGFEEIPKGMCDGRVMAKALANHAVMTLNAHPDHPNRERIASAVRKQSQIADMDDDQYLSHQLHEANPVHKLTQDEKLQCIRELPLDIVRKLFPHV